MIERRIWIQSVLATALSAVACVASAQTVLKAADVHPAGYPTVVAVESMAKKMEAATNGRFKFQMFPGSVLGGEKEMIEQALLRNNFSRTNTARNLGISRVTLYNKTRKYGMLRKE